jgi:hypothetical protein
VADPRHTYATPEQLADISGLEPADVDRLLRDATAEVDGLLHFATYSVDETGMPTEPQHVEALMLATVEVVRWWDANGWDGSGAEGGVQSASIAGVSLGFTTGKQGGRVDLVGVKARRVLAAAGLLGGASSTPWTY